MGKITYDMIEPNVAETEVNGANVAVTWKCPVSGKIVGKTEAQMQATTSATRSISQAAQRTLLESAVQGFVSFISRTFGGLAGQVAGSAAMPAKASAFQQVGRPVYTKASENQAAVTAFELVKDKFRWDENRELFVAVS
jgi:hypothetical protein